jgi:hypothetical protein
MYIYVLLSLQIHLAHALAGALTRSYSLEHFEMSSSKRKHWIATTASGSKKAAKQQLDLPAACVGCDLSPSRNGTWGGNDPSTGMPVGVFCSNCNSFAKASGLTADDIVQVRSGRDKGKAERLNDDILQAKDSIENPADRPFIPERVYELTVVGSRVETMSELQSRTSFKEEHDVYPDDAKLMQVRVKGPDGDIVAVSKNESAPTLVRYCDKQLIHLKPVLLEKDHLYGAQLDQLMTTLIEERAKQLGQSDGNKYQYKKRNAEVYTTEEIDSAVAKVKSGAGNPECGVEGLLAGGQQSHAKPVTLKVSPRGGQKPLALTNAPHSSSSSGLANASPPLDRSPSPGSVRSDSGRVGTQSSFSFGGPEGRDGTQDVEAEEDEVALTQGRLKTAAYWVSEITTEKAWKQIVLTRKISWATACVTRTSKIDVNEVGLIS